jgi:hypothetical protein
LRKATPELMAILGNERIIALDQDPAGNQAVLAFDTDDLQIYVKTLADGGKAVALFNRTAAPLPATLTADHLKYTDDAPVRLDDLWSGASSSFTGEQALVLAPHETRVFTASGERQLPEGLYLSEMPGSVNVAEDGIVHPEADPSIHRTVIAWQGTHGAGEPPRYAGWGGAGADRAPYGQHLRIAGQPYASGLGILANSRLEVRNRGYKRFAAEVGVDDSATDTTQRVRFELYGDGKLLAQSEWLGFGQKAQPLRAGLAGQAILELVVRTAEPSERPTPVTWGNAALLR